MLQALHTAGASRGDLRRSRVVQRDADGNPDEDADDSRDGYRAGVDAR